MKFAFVVFLFTPHDVRMSKVPAATSTSRALALAGDLRVMAGQLKRRLRAQAKLGDLTLSQVSVLRRLESDGPSTVTTLARAEGMRPQSMGANVSTLQAAGFVRSTADPNDGRQTLWSITPACRTWIKAGRAAREDWLFRTLRQKLTPAEQEQLARAMELLKRVVDA
jgi:DNA-binding MarR family transcriptional regulator